MHDLVKKLQTDFPSLNFATGKQFYWSPETNEVVYVKAATGKEATWSLLHETGHALLGHTTYQADVALLRLEVEAWASAKSLAKRYGIKIGEDHIED